MSALALILVLATQPAAKPLSQDGAIAFLGIHAKTGVDADTSSLIAEVILTHLQGVHSRVIGGSDLEAVLSADAMRGEFGCDDTACLAELGMALGARYLMSASAGRVGTRYILNFKLIDTNTIEVLNRVSDTTATSLDELVEILGPTVKKLVPERAAGPAVTGAVSPLPDASSSGEPVLASTMPTTEKSSGGISAWTITGLVSTGVGVAGGIVLGVVAKNKESELADMGTPTAADVTDYNDLRSSARGMGIGADVMFVVAAAGAGLALASWLMGGDDPGDSSTVTVQVAPNHVGVTYDF